MALNFNKKLASILIAGYITISGAIIYNSCNTNSKNTEKKINFNNKEYLVRKDEGFINTFYHITSPPINLDVPPRLGASFEYYIARKNDNGIIVLWSYRRFNNDTLEAQIDNKNDSGFIEKQDTLEMFIEEFENEK